MNNQQYPLSSSEDQSDASTTVSEQPLKRVQYKFIPICRFSGESFDSFYLSGELFIDLTQKNKSISDKTSFWNLCKEWNKSVIEHDQRIMIIQIQNKMMPLQDITKYQKRYFEYPDQNIHRLFKVIDYYLKTMKQYTLMQKQYCEQIKASEFLQSQQFMKRVLFDKYIASYLSALKKDTVYVGSCVGPDIEKGLFLGYNAMFSESMCILLGKSLSQMQDIYQRNGGYNYLDYESNIEVTIRSIKNVFNNVYKLENLPDFMREDSEDTFQLRFISYDEIAFYGTVTVKIITLRDILPELDPAQLSDYCAAFLFIDISPSTLRQIITIRQQNNAYDDSDGFHNLEYTLFAEIFKEKMGNLNYKQQKLQNQFLQSKHI